MSNENLAVDKAIADRMLTLPDSREQLEMIRDLQDLERAVETLGEKFTKPTDLVNVPVDIIDAFSTEITDQGEAKRVVIFVVAVKDGGEVNYVMQTATAPRQKIADYFGKFRVIGVPRKLEDYQLIESDKETNQPNKALIWARAPKQVGKTAGKNK